ncbi:hypothetical protein [Treponema sp. Marseille-Q4130]|uniref:hypothetical protein n=1 Tax=Treponema sp. Marseille-Q4130 TaxID=2766702 RepID=UPI001651B6F4|nr:hypothetical protein [Treponema sp. Marseille-Q4130]MBC6720300.1 hypothetical protein [Treponema sp. Marseille-Q4130]
MKYKIIGFIGMLLFAAAVVTAQFVKIPSVTVIEIALAAFGLAAVVISMVETAKEKNNFSWKTVVIIVLAVIGGVLCCIGGLSQNIFKTVSGAILAALTVIFGILFDKKSETANGKN